MLQMPESVVSAFRSFNFRGKARLLNSVSPKTGTKRACVFQSLFELDCADFIQRQIYLGVFERHETRLVRGFLRPGMTFVDVGANVGYYTALAARQVGATGRVIAFEPSPYAFKRLKATVSANALNQVCPVNSGLSDTPGHVKLYLGVNSDNHSPTMVEHSNTIATEATVALFDSEAERLNIDRIDLLKIDVEGYEPKVLAGATRLLRERRIRAVLCEFNEHWLLQAGSSPQDLERILTQAGFVEQKKTDTPLGFDNRFFVLA